jgi:hypothetical protein
VTDPGSRGATSRSGRASMATESCGVPVASRLDGIDSVPKVGISQANRPTHHRQLALTAARQGGELNQVSVRVCLPRTGRPLTRSQREEGEASVSCEQHILRKGYYENSDADFICLLCGAEFSNDQLDPDPTVPIETPRVRPRE